MNQINNFEDGLRYKLYSDMDKIIHPTISKKNISSYKIVLNEEILPVRVFYPEKISQLDKVIIYIHGISSVSGCGNHYAEICMNLAIKTKQLVIAVDYEENKRYLDALNDISRCVEFLCDELKLLKIGISEITLMGDSIGATMVLGVNKMMNRKITKCILVSPVLSGDYFDDVNVDKNDKVNTGLVNSLKNYYSNSLRFKKNYKDQLVFPLFGDDFDFDKGLIIIGSNDFLKEEAYKYSEMTKSLILEIPFVGHGFLKNMSLDIESEFYNKVHEFLND